MTANPARSAVVVGAGVAGLAVAGGLARDGWDVTLLERAERLRAEPTAVLLWPAAVRALHQLGVGLDAIATVVPDHGVRHPDGRWLVQPNRGGVAGGSRPLLVHAEDLHDALFAGLGDRVEIHTGVPVRPALLPAELPTALPAELPTALPTVGDGSRSWSGQLVVAADGAGSELRTVVDRRCRVVSAGASTWRAVIPWFRAPRLSADVPLAGLASREGYQFFCAPLGQRGATGVSSRGGLFWWATVSGAARPEPAATQLALLQRWFAGWHAPVGELLGATEPEDLVQRELRELRPVPRRLAVARGDGAVVLAGDAGHAMAERLGQGAGLALEDAAALVGQVREAVPGAPLHEAVARFDRSRRRRADEVRRSADRLAATGALARLASVQARRRDRAASAVSGAEPAVTG